ncbi:hypothetical protein NR488_002562 [Salmonella enterica]|nr:hypothetical protein [Salmonella enterica]EFT1737521.1 hypothetical protein [Salmonella enterica]EGB5199518.1 hypothetical protein [Salmonella enterica]EGC6205085.1 hypothetical protein [Salmonella enterica]EGG8568226.1 hypothetical protein [Salmonella enterica]
MHPLAPTTTKLSKSKLADFQIPVKSVIKVVLGSSRQWRTTILQVVLAVM